MNIAELSIRKGVITWVMIVLLLVVGGYSFYQLAWLEDPEFTIKDAIIMTPYPGASAAEVEEEVTNVLEKAVQQLGQLKYVESRSARGMSQIKAKVHDRYDKYLQTLQAGRQFIGILLTLRRSPSPNIRKRVP